MKSIKKSNIRQIPFSSLNREKKIQKNPENLESINVQKLLKQFRTQKSHTKTDRSQESFQNTAKLKNSNIVYQSYSNRYKNYSTIVKNMGQNNKNIKKNESKSTLKNNINVIPTRKAQSALNNYKQKNTSDKVLMARLGQLIQQFEKKDEQVYEFENYIKEIAYFNEKFNKIIKELKQQRINKGILQGLKNMIAELSRRCILKLYQKQSEFEQTADENLKNISEVVEQESKMKYEKKISRLLEIISQKQKKQRQVTKLFYYLRKNGINLQQAWKKATKQQKNTINKNHPQS